MKRFVLVFVALLSVVLGGLMPREIYARDEQCEEVPLGLVARIEAGMKYFDVWLQAPRAVPSYEFGPDARIVSADMGGPDYESDVDMAHWLVTSLDPAAAEIYKIDAGHADYLSDLPDAGDAGFEVGLLTESLGVSQECAMEAAKETGGLGIDRATWEERHGKTNDAQGGVVTTGGSILFREAEGRIAEITWTLREHRPVAEVKVLSHDLIPDDSLRAGISAEAPPSTVDQPDIYVSEWLAEQFEDERLWGGSEPGTFTVSFLLDEEGLAESFSLALGTPGGTN